MNFDQDRRKFFDMLSGLKTFQLFSDKKDKKIIPKIFHLNECDFPESWLFKLEDLNAGGSGVFMTINETNGNGRSAADVIRVRAVFADFDKVPVDLDPVWACNPSMVVESSPGKFHVYWLTYDTPLDGFKQIQQSIIWKFKSDDKIHDLPRVLRVPGFFHSKGERFMVRIIEANERKYSFSELTEIFPPKPAEKWSAPKYIKQPDYNRDDPFKGSYGASEGGRNNHVATRVGGMLKRRLPWHEIEEEAFKEGMSCNPPLPKSEIRAILKSLRRYA